MKAAPPAALWLTLLAAGCALPEVPAPPPAPTTRPIVIEPLAASLPAAPVPVVEPTAPMTEAEAERYVVALLDRDRADHDLPPLAWDETAARAARRHARDLSMHGVTSHVGTDGSVPEERYTDAGGHAVVFENVACFSDGEERTPDPEARFAAAALSMVERAFMDESPPHDGHRRNILGAHHTSVGVGLSQPKGLRVTCLVQELVDDYGAFQELPPLANAGRIVEVAGNLRPPAVVAGVGVSRVDLPRARHPDELRPIRGYEIPSPFVMYWPKGSRTPIELHVDAAGTAFWIHVPLGAEGERGLYGVSVWARFPGEKAPSLVSLRTVLVY